jgi:hypothetical protein
VALNYIQLWALLGLQNLQVSLVELIVCWHVYHMKDSLPHERKDSLQHERQQTWFFSRAHLSIIQSLIPGLFNNVFNCIHYLVLNSRMTSGKEYGTGSNCVMYFLPGEAQESHINPQARPNTPEYKTGIQPTQL